MSWVAVLFSVCLFFHVSLWTRVSFLQRALNDGMWRKWAKIEFI